MNKVINTYNRNGLILMFFRQKGTKVKYKMNKELLEYISDKDEYIIQYQGYPDYDSGYRAYTFSTLEEAKEHWNKYVIN